MFDLSSPQSTGAYLRDLWSHRHLMVELARADIKQRHVDTALGNLWYFLNPLILTIIYYGIFGIVLETSRGVDQEDFLVYLTIGVGLFRFAQQGVTSGARSLITNRRLVRLIRFPRAVLPLSGVLAELASVGPAILIGTAVAVVVGKPPRAEWLLVIPAAMLLVIFVAGVAMVTARMVEVSGDVLKLLPWAFRILFYMSGVLYSVNEFIHVASQRQLFLINPLHSLLSLARHPFTPDASPADWLVVVVAVGWTLAATIGGLLFFKAGEVDYGRE